MAAQFNKLINIDVNSKSLKELEKDLVEIEKEITDINTDLKATNKTLAEQASIQNKLNQLQNKQKQISESKNLLILEEKQAISRENAIKRSENLKRVAEGVAGAFQLGTAAGALFGEKTAQEIEKASQKVILLVGLTDSIKKVSEAYNAGFSLLNENFKKLTLASKVFGVSLKSALIGSGIGILIVGLGLVIANFEKIEEFFTRNSIKKGLESQNESLNRQVSILEKSAIPAYQQRLQIATNQIKLNEIELEQETKRVARINAIIDAIGHVSGVVKIADKVFGDFGGKIDEVNQKILDGLENEYQERVKLNKFISENAISSAEFEYNKKTELNKEFLKNFETDSKNSQDAVAKKAIELEKENIDNLSNFYKTKQQLDEQALAAEAENIYKSFGLKIEAIKKSSATEEEKNKQISENQQLRDAKVEDLKLKIAKSRNEFELKQIEIRTQIEENAIKAREQRLKEALNNIADLDKNAELKLLKDKELSNAEFQQKLLDLEIQTLEKTIATKRSYNQKTVEEEIALEGKKQEKIQLLQEQAIQKIEQDAEKEIVIEQEKTLAKLQSNEDYAKNVVAIEIKKNEDILKQLEVGSEDYIALQKTINDQKLAQAQSVANQLVDIEALRLKREIQEASDIEKNVKNRYSVRIEAAQNLTVLLQKQAENDNKNQLAALKEQQQNLKNAGKENSDQYRNNAAQIEEINKNLQSNLLKIEADGAAAIQNLQLERNAKILSTVQNYAQQSSQIAQNVFAIIEQTSTAQQESIQANIDNLTKNFETVKADLDAQIADYQTIIDNNKSQLEENQTKIDELEQKLTDARGARSLQLRTQLDDEIVARNKLKKEIEKNAKAKEKAEKELAQKEIDNLNKVESEKARIAQIEEERKKRAKILAIGQAILNTALAVSGALIPSPTNLPPINLVTAALTSAAGLSAIALAATAKYNQGGIIEGPSHSEGGVPARVGGRNMVELEGQEVIINKRSAALFRKELSDINSYNGYGKRFALGGPVPSVNNFSTTNSQIFNQLENRPVVVSVEEINRVNNRVKVIETDSGI